MEPRANQAWKIGHGEPGNSVDATSNHASEVRAPLGETDGEGAPNWTTELDHEMITLWALWDSNPGPTDYESAALTV